jgi:hypothetical protein
VAAPAGNDDVVDVPIIVEMRQQHRRGDWPGVVRSEDPRYYEASLLASCCSEAGIERLYRAIAGVGNRCGWGRLRCTHSS